MAATHTHLHWQLVHHAIDANTAAWLWGLSDASAWEIEYLPPDNRRKVMTKYGSEEEAMHAWALIVAEMVLS